MGLGLGRGRLSQDGTDQVDKGQNARANQDGQSRSSGGAHRVIRSVASADPGLWVGGEGRKVQGQQESQRLRPGLNA